MSFHAVIAICFFATANVFAQVGQRTYVFEDGSRSRKIVTEVWYPTNTIGSVDNESPFVRIPTTQNAKISNGVYPLILFSHGTGGGRLTVEWFCAGLASKGFIVAAVDHFGNTFDNPIPEAFAKFWERPQDIRFALDQLLKSDFAASINSKAVGAAGFSLGGYTAIALAGAKIDYEALVKYFKTENGKKEADIPEMPGLLSLFDKPEIQESFDKAPSLHDQRIKSIFVMAPALGQGFPSREKFNKVTVPVFIAAAEHDQICPVKTNAYHYAALLPAAQLQIVSADAGHYVFLNEAREMLKSEAPLLFNDPAGVDRGEVHAKTLSHAVEHFTRTLKHTSR